MKYELNGISTPIGGFSWDKITTGKEMFAHLFLYFNQSAF